MNALEHSTKKEVRGRLLAAGYTLTEFAEAHGVGYELVRKVLVRYCGKRRTPRGAKTKAVLRGLAPYAKRTKATNR